MVNYARRPRSRMARALARYWISSRVSGPICVRKRQKRIPMSARSLRLMKWWNSSRWGWKTWSLGEEQRGLRRRLIEVFALPAEQPGQAERAAA